MSEEVFDDEEFDLNEVIEVGDSNEVVDEVYDERVDY
jgi:hypothetical protein